MEYKGGNSWWNSVSGGVWEFSQHVIPGLGNWTFWITWRDYLITLALIFLFQLSFTEEQTRSKGSGLKQYFAHKYAT